MSQATPAPKQLNLESLAMQAGLNSAAARRRQKPTFEFVSVYPSMLHHLARAHLKTLSKTHGMPTPSKDPSLLELNQNLNYFSSSKYLRYGPDENEELSQLYLRYLQFEAINKGREAPSLRPENLLFISSSMAIDLLIRAFCEPSIDRVGIASPTFPLYTYCALANRTEVVDIPLLGAYFEKIDTSKIIECSPKLTFFPIPNNPVGNVPDRQLLVECLEKGKGILTVDEAYIDFSPSPSYCSLVNQYPNLVILRSFSKGWGLAGIRSGVVIGSQALIQTLKVLIPPYSFPLPIQEILSKVLTHPEELFEMRKKVEIEREFLTHFLKTLPIVEKLYPSQTNFLLAKFREGDSVFEALKNDGILVKNFSPCLPNTLRISLGTSETNQRLARSLEKVKIPSRARNFVNKNS